MIDLPTGFTYEHYCELVAESTEQFVEVARGVDPQTQIATCPGWTLAKLIRHTGTVHRWATEMVSSLSTERTDPRSLNLALPDDDRWLPGWLQAGSELLVETLAAAEADAPMWAWGADQHVRFWARRMLHETTVHRVDASPDLGHATIEPLVAADGIDELFVNLPCAAGFSPEIAELNGEGSLGFVALDRALGPAARWLVDLSDDGFTVARAENGEAEHADVLVSGPPDQVLLLLYGRVRLPSQGLVLSGDESLLDWWLDNSAIQ